MALHPKTRRRLLQVLPVAADLIGAIIMIGTITIVVMLIASLFGE